jgi:hypothetical protein
MSRDSRLMMVRGRRDTICWTHNGAIVSQRVTKAKGHKTMDTCITCVNFMIQKLTYHMRPDIWFINPDNEMRLICSATSRIKADSHMACCVHAVPLPCRAAKGLECVCPI